MLGLPTTLGLFRETLCRLSLNVAATISRQTKDLLDVLVGLMLLTLLFSTVQTLSSR